MTSLRVLVNDKVAMVLTREDGRVGAGGGGVLKRETVFMSRQKGYRENRKKRYVAK